MKLCIAIHTRHSEYSDRNIHIEFLLLLQVYDLLTLFRCSSDILISIQQFVASIVSIFL